jgi:hypothetical protein
MATVSYSFDTDSVGTENTADNDTNITGFSHQCTEPWNHDSITENVAAFEDSRCVKIYDAIGSGSSITIMAEVDTIGSLGTNVETDVLVQFEMPSSGSNFHIIRMRMGTLAPDADSIALTSEGTEGQLRVADWRGATVWDWVGVAVTVTGLNWDEVWWFRMQVASGGAGSFQWKAWADGASEPGSWNQTGLTYTAQTAGYCGFGELSTECRWGWFAIGTVGDDAPGPSAGGPTSEITPLMATRIAS